MNKSIGAIVIMMLLAATPTPSSAASADDYFDKTVWAGLVGIRFKGITDEYRSGRFNLGRYYLKIRDLDASVTYLGSASQYRVRFKITVTFDGKKIQLSSKGFSLSTDQKTCTSPQATGGNKVQTVSLKYSGEVCAGEWGSGSGFLTPQKVTYRIDWDVTENGGAVTAGHHSWNESLVYD